MTQIFSNRSIARKLQIGVGLAAGLVLGLTVWLNYRSSRSELEQQKAEALATWAAALTKIVGRVAERRA